MTGRYVTGMTDWEVDGMKIDLETSEEMIYGNIARRDVQGIRSQSLRRLIVLDAVVRYEYQVYHGPAYQWWGDQDGPYRSMLNFVMALTATQYQRLEPAAREIFGEQDADWFLDVSERTARDYITALKHFYL